MESSPRRTLRYVVLALLVVTGIRVYLIYRSRHEPPPKPAALPTDLDVYVTPKKVYAFDVKSARAIVGTPVWVKAGYGAAYYAYNPANKRADFGHEAGLLAPIEKLEIRDVVAQPVPGGEWKQAEGNPGFRIRVNEKAVMAVFAKEGKEFAFPIGGEAAGDYHFMLDDLLYIQDPHELYSHWPQQVWQNIAAHQIQKGMNEMQVSFAIGVPDGVSQNGDEKTVHYANNGQPWSVTFNATGKVVSASAGSR